MDQPDVLGKALLDFYHNRFRGKLKVHNNYGKPEFMPPEVFFESEDELSELDRYALSLCEGSVLDIGAAAGKHSLILQEHLPEVVALDFSPGCIALMQERGIRQPEFADIYKYSGRTFDTLLLLMNGIGLAENMEGYRLLLRQFHLLLNPGGQVLLDSSDISYLFSVKEDRSGHYYGEISYSFEYRKEMGNWFGWLYLDPEIMAEIAEEEGFSAQVLFMDNTGQYLARLVPSE